jgi:hypothetical protein
MSRPTATQTGGGTLPWAIVGSSHTHPDGAGEEVGVMLRNDGPTRDPVPEGERTETVEGLLLLVAEWAGEAPHPATSSSGTTVPIAQSRPMV